MDELFEESIWGLTEDMEIAFRAEATPFASKLFDLVPVARHVDLALERFIRWHEWGFS